eukprot:Rhum_TRINITY_DN3686_c0_g1::Rhum_TRINITY_DN3686_c0_g1_i1::g.11708::m.11708
MAHGHAGGHLKRWVPIDNTNAAAARPDARTKFSSVEHGGNMYIFAGGNKKVFYGDLWAFDIQRSTWRCVAQDTSKVGGPTRRRSHCSVVWGSKMVTFGGRMERGRVNDVYVFDFASETWEQRFPQRHGPIPPARAAHSASIWGDTMLIFGGDQAKSWQPPTKEKQPELWSYDCVRDVWTEPSCSGDNPCWRLGHNTVVLGNELYLFGGFNNGTQLDDLYVCDLERRVWRQVRYNTPVARRSFFPIVADTPTSFLLWGGAFTVENATDDHLYRFLVDRQDFVEIHSIGKYIPARRLGHAMVLGPSKQILMFGGCDQEYYNDLHVVDAPSLKEYTAYHILRHIDFDADTDCNSHQCNVVATLKASAHRASTARRLPSSDIHAQARRTG